MIIGLFCTHLKAYKNQNFIPISEDIEKPFSLLLGANAVGKSAVLEGLDIYFNSKKFNKTLDTKSQEAYVAPVLLISKDKIRKSEILEQYLEDVNITFRNEEFKTKTDSQAYQKFEEFRNRINDKYPENEYYFLTVGVSIDGSVHFGPIDREMIGEKRNAVDNVIREYYNYLYIPAESNISDITQIGNIYMQKLMNMELKDELRKILNSEKNKKSIMSDLNNALKNQVEQVNNVIKEFDSSYEYQSRKQNLQANDIIQSIIESYFSIKSLSKDRKSIEQLSSGEQRIALLNLLIAFSRQKDTVNKQLVLAIDEPEISLNFEKIFEQFDKLLGVASSVTQVIATTHWYGVLPLLQEGNICYVSKNEKGIIEHYLFEGNSFQDQDFQKFNRSIELKSYHDLTSSILSSLRLGMNWVICEGVTDKKYLEYYLPNKTSVRVLSVKGAGNVAKLYQYLATPMMFNEFAKSDYGKIICIIDTDSNATVVKNISENLSSKHKKIKNLKIKRIAHYQENTPLVAIDNETISPSSIEDVLDPKQFFKSIKQVIQEEEPEIANKLVYNKKRKQNFHSNIRDEFDSIIDKTLLTREEIEVIYQKLSEGPYKNKIAEHYISHPSNGFPNFFSYVIEQELDMTLDILNSDNIEKDSLKRLTEFKISTLKDKREFLKLYWDAIQDWKPIVNHETKNKLTNFISGTRTQTFGELDEAIKTIKQSLKEHT